MLQVMWLALTNQRSLFKNKVITLLWNYSLRLDPRFFIIQKPWIALISYQILKVKLNPIKYLMEGFKNYSFTLKLEYLRIIALSI